MKEKTPKERFATLSNREREVLQLVCQYKEYPEIAEIFVISESTVKTHMDNTFIKLGLKHLKRDKRVIALHTTYCPMFSEMDESTNDIEEKEIIDSAPEPVQKSEPEMETVPITSEEEIIDSDEEEIIIDTPKPKKGGKEKMGTGKGRRALRLVFVLIVVALLAFGGWQGLKWFSKIPIGSSGSAYEVGEWHKEDDMWIRLREYELDNYPNDEIVLYVEIWNKSNQEIHFAWATETHLELIDNIGTRYPLTSWYENDSDNETLLPQERSDLKPGVANATAAYYVDRMFEGGVTELLFSIDYLSRFEKVTWRIPVNK